MAVSNLYLLQTSVAHALAPWRTIGLGDGQSKPTSCDTTLFMSSGGRPSKPFVLCGLDIILQGSSWTVVRGVAWDIKEDYAGHARGA